MTLESIVVEKCADMLKEDARTGVESVAPPSVLVDVERAVGPYAVVEECDGYADRGAWRELREEATEPRCSVVLQIMQRAR